MLQNIINLFLNAGFTSSCPTLNHTFQDETQATKIYNNGRFYAFLNDDNLEVVDCNTIVKENRMVWATPSVQITRNVIKQITVRQKTYQACQDSIHHGTSHLVLDCSQNDTDGKECLTS